MCSGWYNDWVTQQHARCNNENKSVMFYGLERDRHCTYTRKIEARSRNRCYRAITRNITYYDCVFATLVLQHVKCARRIMWASVAWPGIQYFPTLPYKRHYFQGKQICLNKKCLFWFSLQLFFLKHFSFREELNENIVINVHRSPRVVPGIVIKLFMKPEFSQQIFEKSSNIKFHELFLADGQTNTQTEVNAAESTFSQFFERA